MRRSAVAALATAGTAFLVPASPAAALPCNVGFTLAPVGRWSECYVGDLTGFVGVVDGSVRTDISCLNHTGSGSASGPVAVGGPFSGLTQCFFRITATSPGTTAQFVAT